MASKRVHPAGKLVSFYYNVFASHKMKAIMVARHTTVIGWLRSTKRGALSGKSSARSARDEYTRPSSAGITSSVVLSTWSFHSQWVRTSKDE